MIDSPLSSSASLAVANNDKLFYINATDMKT